MFWRKPVDAGSLIPDINVSQTCGSRCSSSSIPGCSSSWCLLPQPGQLEGRCRTPETPQSTLHQLTGLAMANPGYLEYQFCRQCQRVSNCLYCYTSDLKNIDKIQNPINKWDEQACLYVYNFVDFLIINSPATPPLILILWTLTNTVIGKI